MPEKILPPEPATPNPKSGYTPRKRALARNDALRKELQTYISHWQEINDFVLPRRLAYLSHQKNDGSKKNGKIYNAAATKAARILASGKMANETSPARPFFRAQLPRDLRSDARCKEWISIVEEEIYAAMARSNVYAKLHELWALQGTFGTAVIYIEEDDKDDIVAYVFPLGQWAIASTGKGRVDVISREFQTMTVEEVVLEFGLENVSPEVKRLWETEKLDEKVAIIHIIQPNINRKTGKIDNWNMPFIAEWWEKDAAADWEKPLRRSGYEERPFMVARWNVTGDDVYGSDCPGMDALGDVKELQHTARQRSEAFDKHMTPPMKAPTSARRSRLSMLPRDVSYTDEAAQGTKLEPMIKIDPAVIGAADSTEEKIQRRIFEHFFADLFQMFLMDEAQQPRTATDINRRYEEKMIQLGPVVELDNDDVLDPMINRIFRILGRRGKIPPPPPEMRGRRVQLEYVSTMAQAQKLLGTAARERFLSIIGSVSAVYKNALDLPQFDKILKNYADMVGLKPEEINPQEVIDALRRARQQAEAQAQALQNAQVAADAAKSASAAEVSNDSVLSRLLAGTGMGGPSAYGGA